MRPPGAKVYAWREGLNVDEFINIYDNGRVNILACTCILEHTSLNNADWEAADDMAGKSNYLIDALGVVRDEPFAKSILPVQVFVDLDTLLTYKMIIININLPLNNKYENCPFRLTCFRSWRWWEGKVQVDIYDDIKSS